MHDRVNVVKRKFQLFSFLQHGGAFGVSVNFETHGLHLFIVRADTPGLCVGLTHDEKEEKNDEGTNHWFEETEHLGSWQNRT